jgi:hypothetical protein
MKSSNRKDHFVAFRVDTTLYEILLIKSKIRRVPVSEIVRDELTRVLIPKTEDANTQKKEAIKKPRRKQRVSGFGRLKIRIATIAGRVFTNK